MNDKTEEPIALRIDYRKINPKCYICDGPSTVIRITQATDGELYVSTLCDEHAKGEQEHVDAEGDLENVPGTGTFINFELYDKLLDTGAMDELREVMASATAKGGG